MRVRSFSRVALATVFASALLTVVPRISGVGASDHLSLCEALSQYANAYDSFLNGPNAAQDLALSPRLVPLLRAIRRQGPDELRDFWTVAVRHYARGVRLLRHAGLDSDQLEAIARWDISKGDNAAVTMIDAAHPSDDVMAKVVTAFEYWQKVVDHAEEPRLHGQKLVALRSEFRSCGVS